jgi:hypothetical protein
MRKYDRALPLIFIHIPKTAGTSVRTIFSKWYSNALYEHYFNECTGSPPQKLDLAWLHSISRPVAVYGHFNRLRGAGVEDYYPEAKQFITILRDPFEMEISNYYFIRKVSTNWKDQSRVPKTDLRQHLMNSSPNMLNQFPRLVTRDNYQEQIEEFFIEVGIMERLSDSVQLIAEKLNMPFQRDWLPHIFATDRDQDHPYDLREEYIEKHPLEFDVYNYAASKFTPEVNLNSAREITPEGG